MSQNSATWNTAQYENRAIHIYQQKGNRLRPTVSQAMRIEGNEKAIFWIAGKTKAVKQTRRTRNQPMNGDRKKIEAYLSTWRAFDVVEEYDVDRMSVDEKEVIYESGANALGRATDIEIYAQMATAVPAVPTDLDFSAGAFSAANAMMLCKYLQDDKVPWDGQVYCGLPALQWNQFLANKVVNSADHVGPGGIPFVGATDTRFWNGVNWFLFVEEDPQDLYPVPSTNKQDLFIWHKTAMGWGNHTDLKVIPVWDNYENWWTINMSAKGVATPLQEGRGVKRFRTSSNSAIAIV